jgi:hypothetical protein
MNFSIEAGNLLRRNGNNICIYIIAALRQAGELASARTGRRAPLGRGANRVLGPRSGAVAVRHLGAEMRRHSRGPNKIYLLLTLH